MSAIPEDFIKKTTALSDEVTRPFAGARKIYVAGSRPDIRVPMREIEQAPTPASFGAEENPPITVYDTSGPFTDPAAHAGGGVYSVDTRSRGTWLGVHAVAGHFAALTNIGGDPIILLVEKRFGAWRVVGFSR